MSLAYPPAEPKALADAFRLRAEREMRARKAAESLLEQKSLELFQTSESLRAAQSRLEQHITEIADERDRVVLMSKIDLLTQLPNRAAAIEQLDRRLDIHRQSNSASDSEVWLVLILLKKFKRVNKLLGQIGADIVLQTVAECLRKIADERHGLAARFSGTEFALVLTGDSQKLSETIERVSAELSQPMRVNQKELVIDFALAAAGSGLAGNSVDDIRAAVDSTLSRVRRCGPENISVYDETIRNTIRERRKLEQDLREAIAKEEIVPWFQPILCCADSNVISIESLARWPSRGGLISPATFLPIAHDIGLSEQLEEHLFMTACRQARRWIETGHVADLSINMSPSELSQSDFIPRLKERLEATQFPARNLILEITEDALVENPAFVSQQINELHKMGVKIAVDDFGTGYSNLHSLIGLPIDTVKIDRSLVWEMERENRAAMLIATLVQWARAINVSVVAEGVETPTQALILRSLGCDRLQGFHFGRAMSAKQMEARMSKTLIEEKFGDDI